MNKEYGKEEMNIFLKKVVMKESGMIFTEFLLENLLE